VAEYNYDSVAEKTLQLYKTVMESMDCPCPAVGRTSLVPEPANGM